MKKAFVVASLLVVTNSFAFTEDPKQQFDMTRNTANTVTVTFKQAANVTAECDRESKARGGKGYRFSVDACSFWDRSVVGPDVCTIITGTSTNFHIIGHEMRHCIQGNFHK
jgi:hypothetical protein